MTNLVSIDNQQNNQNNLRSYSLEDLFVKFFSSIRISEETYRMYKYSLDCFFKWLKEKKVNTPAEEHIIKYLDSEHFNKNKSENSVNFGKPVTSATQAMYMAAIRRFFKWLNVKKVYPNITEGIEILKEKNDGGYTRKALQKHEVRLLLDTIDTTKITGIRDYAIISLMAGTGIREIEVYRSNIEDIKMSNSDIVNNKGNVLFFIQRKRKKQKEGFVVLTDNALPHIQNYLSYRKQIESSDPLFITHGNKSKGKRLSIKSIQDMIYERIKQAGIKRPGICGHSLRHFFGTQLIEKGVPIKKIQLAFGHSNQSTTEIYTKDIDRLTDPVEKQIEF